MNIAKEIAVPILKQALPLILIQICQASFGLINTIIAGRYHYLDLAGIGLGSNIWTPVFVFCTGALYVLVPKFSFFKQQQDHAEAIQLYRRAKRLALLLSCFAFIAIHVLAFMCPYFIPDPRVAPITQNYLHFVAFGMPGLVYMVMYRFMSEGHSELGPVILTLLTILIFDASWSAVLVNGWGPFPEMGGAGAGVATLLTAYMGCLMMRHLVCKNLPHIQSGELITEERFRDSMQLFKQGAPIGVAFVLQILALATLAFFAAELGTKVVAAHQIVINIAMMFIMIPVALSSATTIQVSRFTAAKNKQARVRTGFVAAGFTLIYGLFMVAILIVSAHKIIKLFSQDQTVLEIASGLVVYAAIFLFFDAFQIVAGGALRGVQKFLPPLLVILFCYWIVIIPLSYAIGVHGWFDIPASVDMIWMILMLGMSLAAFILVTKSYLCIKE